MLGETPGGIKRRRNPKFNFSQQLPVSALILQQQSNFGVRDNKSFANQRVR